MTPSEFNSSTGVTPFSAIQIRQHWVSSFSALNGELYCPGAILHTKAALPAKNEGFRATLPQRVNHRRSGTLRAFTTAVSEEPSRERRISGTSSITASWRARAERPEIG